MPATADTGQSAAFALFHRAILERRPLTCRYKGLIRDICPHVLGHSHGREMALVYQFGGQTRTHLPPGGEWRCLDLAEVSDIGLHRSGTWHTGRQHTRTQHCVDQVHIDVNEDVLDQPGRL